MSTIFSKKWSQLDAITYFKSESKVQQTLNKYQKLCNCRTFISGKKLVIKCRVCNATVLRSSFCSEDFYQECSWVCVSRVLSLCSSDDHNSTANKRRIDAWTQRTAFALRTRAYFEPVVADIVDLVYRKYVKTTNNMEM